LKTENPLLKKFDDTLRSALTTVGYWM